jgi:hypothetical protein
MEASCQFAQPTYWSILLTFQGYQQVAFERGACGVDAGCNCGAPLISKGQRAAEAIKANPAMSNRKIAEEAGVDEKTVRNIRKKTTADWSALEDDDRPTIDKPPDHCIRSSARMIGASNWTTSS